MAATLVVAAAIAMAVPVLFALRGRVVARLVGQGAPSEAVWAIAALLLMAAVLAVLVFYFQRHLYRIIGTVGEGDPFVPANAERLRGMAWITVAIHVVTVPMVIVGGWVEDVTRAIHFKIDLPLAGLFLALILFILARVFREGTRMREDLEGTV